VLWCLKWWKPARRTNNLMCSRRIPGATSGFFFSVDRRGGVRQEHGGVLADEIC
jgi:hypothetical protein